MASLIERSPAEGLLPIELAGAMLSEVAPGPITSIAPFKGREKAVSAALKPLGLRFPGQGRYLAEGGAAIFWSGRGQAFLIGAGAPPKLAEAAALADQGDGWAALVLTGQKAEAVLARLIPLDLRLAGFGEGRAARSTLGHMPLILTRPRPGEFGLMVFRSMAGTAVHELSVAMRAVAARG